MKGKVIKRNQLVKLKKFKINLQSKWNVIKNMFQNMNNKIIKQKNQKKKQIICKMKKIKANRIMKVN